MKGAIAMNDYNLIRTIQIECPLCGKIHEVEERKRIAATIIKDEKVTYEEIYYSVLIATKKRMNLQLDKIENINLLNARNTYRKAKGLLTSDQIVAIRNMYDLSQVDLARLLGWGEQQFQDMKAKPFKMKHMIICLESLKKIRKLFLNYCRKILINLVLPN